MAHLLMEPGLQATESLRPTVETGMRIYLANQEAYDSVWFKQTSMVVQLQH